MKPGRGGAWVPSGFPTHHRCRGSSSPLLWPKPGNSWQAWSLLRYQLTSWMWLIPCLYLCFTWSKMLSVATKGLRHTSRGGMEAEAGSRSRLREGSSVSDSRCLCSPESCFLPGFLYSLSCSKQLTVLSKDFVCSRQQVRLEPVPALSYRVPHLASILKQFIYKILCVALIF